MDLLDLHRLEALAELGRWSLEGIWLPLLVWTAVSLPVYVFVKVRDDLSPYVRYWTLVALIFSLPLGLAGAAALALLLSLTTHEVAFLTFPAVITVTPAEGADAISWTVWHSAGVAFLLALVPAGWRTGVLAFRLADLRTVRPSASNPEWLVRQVNGLARRIGVRRAVSVSLRDTASPFTIGWARPHIVLPRDLIESADDLRFALTHELIHIRRRDFALQLVEHVIGALFVVHPLVTLLRRDTIVLREITCDADVVASTGDRSAYARLLYRYSSVQVSERSLAVGIFSRDRQLTHRIRAMQTFLSEHGINRSRQMGLMIFAALLAAGVLVVACSDTLINSEPDAAHQAGESSEDVFVVVEEMPEIVGGLASIQEKLVYPELAKEAGVEGRVIVQFIVDEAGRVVDPVVVRGIGSGLDEAALTAVRSAEFVPGKQRGEAVKVKMSLPVTFRLGDGAAPQPTPSTEAAIQIHIDGSDRLYVDGLPVEIEGLESALQRSGLTGESIVSVRVDSDASAGTVADVQAILRSTDVPRIRDDSEAIG